MMHPKLPTTEEDEEPDLTEREKAILTPLTLVQYLDLLNATPASELVQ